MTGLWRDLRFGLRALRRKPGFAAAALLSLVLGIGLNAAIFTLLDAVFLRPIPVPDPARLVAVFQSLKNQTGEYTGTLGLSVPNYRDYLERQHAFDELALYQWWPVNFSGGSDPIRGTVMFVTPNYFDLLGIEPAHGRFFSPSDDPVGREPEAVLSYGAWTRLFAADAGVLGRQVRVNGESLTVVGVAPRGFKGTELMAAPDVFVPLATFSRISPLRQYFDVRSVSFFPALGRLREGVSVAEASAEMMALSQQLAAEYASELEGLGGLALPLAEGTIRSSERGRFESYGRILAGAAGLILLIACLNVANLLLVRGVERARELAVRQAAGSHRGRLLRQLATENLLLFALGGLLSLPAARLALDFLWRFRPPRIPENAVDLELDAAVWAFALGVAVVVGLFFGLVPAWRASRVDMVSHLKESEPLAGRRGLPLLLRPRSLLVAAQVALALVALIGAGLFLANLASAMQIDVGFEHQHLAVLTAAPGDEGYDEAQTREFYRRALERVVGVPGVESAAWSENRLLRGATMRRQVFLDGKDQAEEIGTFNFHRVNVVTPGFFATAGIPLLRGHDFTGAEPADGLAVAIVNETMAKLAWPDREAIGQRFHFDFPDQPPIEVVGVVADARYREIHEPEQFFVYLPLSQNLASTMTLHVRTSRDPTDLLTTLRREVQALDPALPIADAAPLSDFVHEALWLERVSARMLTAFGVLALALAVVGVYGLLSYSVSQKRRDIAIRLAIGAARGDVLARVLLEAAVVVAVGVAAGIVLALGLKSWVASQLYGVEADDPATYALWTAVLVGAALLGSLVPAWRAARTDPMRTLREE